MPQKISISLVTTSVPTSLRKFSKYLTADAQLSGHVQDKMAPYDDDTYIIHGITRMHPYYSPYANDEEGKHYGLTNFQNPLARSDADVSGYRKNVRNYSMVFSP